MTLSQTASIPSPLARTANADVLSLALMDARNRTLLLLSAFEKAGNAAAALAIAGHVAWFNEYWIARNPQRSLGPACPARGPRLASIDPEADEWFSPALAHDRPARELDSQALRSYMLESHEIAIELLEKTPGDDDSLYFFRLALWLEDLRCEQLVELGQSLGVELPIDLPPAAAAREPLGMPASRWRMGVDEEGFTQAVERGCSIVSVPEFEIDSQPVSWAQFGEFIADGGYDRPELWHPEGWHWLERQPHGETRRAPRYVEQIGVGSGAVMQTWFGKPRRMGATQPVVHASWWEADAYARWAGRRLATEEEWEITAMSAHRRGFRWGDVREWTAGTLQPYEGFRPDTWAADARLDARTAFGKARVVRGTSFASRPRMKNPQARHWADPAEDAVFIGFRTCAWV